MRSGIIHDLAFELDPFAVLDLDEWIHLTEGLCVPVELAFNESELQKVCIHKLFSTLAGISKVHGDLAP